MTGSEWYSAATGWMLMYIIVIVLVILAIVAIYMTKELVSYTIQLLRRDKK